MKVVRFEHFIAQGTFYDHPHVLEILFQHNKRLLSSEVELLIAGVNFNAHLWVVFVLEMNYELLLNC